MATEEPRKQPPMNGRIATDQLYLGTSKEVLSVSFSAPVREFPRALFTQ
jgi:hypothetical protein